MCFTKRRILLLKSFFVCVSIATIALSPLWEVLLFSKYNFHHPLPSHNDYISGLILIVLFSFALSSLLYFLRSLSVRKSRFLSSIVVGCFLILPMNQFRGHIDQNISPGFIVNTAFFKITPLIICFILSIF